MTTFIAYIAASADGYVATPDGGVGWLDPFTEGDYGYDGFIGRIGPIVMGRVSYQQVRGFGDWPYEGHDSYVLSGVDLDDLPARARRWRDGAAALVAHLRAVAPDSEVWIMGGPQTLAGFAALGALDRMELFVMPVLLGDGVPLFPVSPRPTALRLLGSRAFSNGALQLSYALGR